MAEQKRGEETSSIANKLILKKAVNKRIDNILKKAFISEKEVYDLVRSFFKKHLSIDYEFTREELMKELKKIYLSPDMQDDVRQLFDDIGAIEHSSKAFSREELARLLEDFRKVVDGLIVSHYQQEKSFIKKLRDNIHNAFSGKHKTILEADDSVLREDERSVVKMNMLLDDAKRLSDVDIAKAKEIYKDLITIYNSLDQAKKKAYYEPVQQLYRMIKTKEKA